MTRIPGSGSPNPGPGRPQYGWSAKDARLPSVATVSRHCTSLGQPRHTDTAASSSATDLASPASCSTSRAVLATGEAGVAGSPGQPAPGGTGDSNSSPVTGCRSWVTVILTSDQGQGNAVEDVMLGRDRVDHAGVTRHPREDAPPDQGTGADHVHAPFMHERERRPRSEEHGQQLAAGSREVGDG